MTGLEQLTQAVLTSIIDSVVSSRDTKIILISELVVLIFQPTVRYSHTTPSNVLAPHPSQILEMLLGVVYHLGRNDDMFVSFHEYIFLISEQVKYRMKLQ